MGGMISGKDKRFTATNCNPVTNPLIRNQLCFTALVLYGLLNYGLLFTAFNI